MVMTRSMTRNQNHDAPSCRKRRNTWSDLTHDVLYLVMRRLGAVEFMSFSGVCKSWRSLALSNRESVMASRPPMIMRISPCDHEKTCYLQDFERREFKTIIPRSGGRECVGLACGYLILFGEEPPCDIWLVNPITRHQLHFPDVPFHVDHPPQRGGVRAVLVFSPPINGWVFVVLNRYTDQIWFCMAAEGVWHHVSSDYYIIDLHAFKGKIYTLHFCGSLGATRHVCELRFDPVPELTVLDTHFPEPLTVFDFVSSDENLCLMEYTSADTYRLHRLGFDDMTWAPCEKTKQDYVLFHSHLKYSAALKPDSWPAPSSSGTFFDTNRRGQGRLYMAHMWYFPHDSLTANLIDF